MKADRRAMHKANAEAEKARRREQRLRSEEKEQQTTASAANALKLLLESEKIKCDEMKAVLGDAPKQIKVIFDAGLSFHAKEMFSSKYSPFMVNTLATWKPQGKGRNSILRSLTKHLFAKYKTPAFLLDAFSTVDGDFLWSVERNAAVSSSLFKYDELIRTVSVRLLNGASLFGMVKAKEFLVPLTRQMCHDFLTNTTVEQGFAVGIRAAQMRAVKLDMKFLGPWMNHAIGRISADDVNPAHREEFFFTVMQWFANNIGGMFDLSQVSTILDYLNHQRNINRDFTMKGRTLQALLRDIEAWHNSLRRTQALGGEAFNMSGHSPLHFQDKDNFWEIVEILGSKELHEEGVKMHHCVYSYRHSISRGVTSIWSMRLNGVRAQTIEVDNRYRMIRQVRGIRNEKPNGAEMKIIQMWAGSNGLVLAKYL